MGSHPRARKAAEVASPRSPAFARERAHNGGVPLLVIGRILGHKVPATTARYAHLADDPVRKAVEAAGDRIAAALAEVAAHRNPDNDGRAPQVP